MMTRPPPLSDSIQIHLSPAMLDALHSYCAETGLSTGAVIRHLLTKLLWVQLPSQERYPHRKA